MAMRQYSVKKLGRDYKVSPHFTLGEFQSGDGADIVLVSDELLEMLEELRGYGDNWKIRNNSGYRTAAYNRKIGGASLSQHVEGTAADIQVIDKDTDKPLDARLMCCLCQSLGFKGVAYISSRSLHVDMRERGTYRGDERSGYSGNVGGDFYRYFNITKAQVEALKKEEEMTQNEFNQMMNTWISQQAAKDPSDWSAAARNWAEENGIISGTGSGYSYLAYCTREQMVQFLYNFYNNVVSKMGGGSGDAVLQAMIDALNGLKK